jgi:phosphoenolpyruvate carboxylase
VTPGAAREVPPDLRRDVRLLTTLLGRAIAETDPEVFAEVERLRHATIALRRHPTDAERARVLQIVRGLDPRRAEAVARAFTAYFQLVNVAEDHHRTRTLRSRRSRRDPAHSIEGAVAWLGERTDPLYAVNRLRVTEVLTAHPTEAKRRAVVEALWRITDLLDEIDDPRVSPADEHAVLRRLGEEVAALWHTDPLRGERPGPLDEVRAILALFDRTIFTTMPLLLREVERALDPDGAGLRPSPVRPFLRWSTWVGGDRDGNPSVTAEVTEEAVRIQADHVLRGLEAAARRIARSLTASEREAPPSAALRAWLVPVEETPAGTALRRRLPDAPHRRALLAIADRLAATREGRPGRYGSAAEASRDVEMLQGSLARRAPRLAFGELQHLRWQLEAFGFHLAEMEVRQHADVHRGALGELVGADVASEAAAIDALLRRRCRQPPAARSAMARQVVATFRAIGRLQERFGQRSCRRVIVSFTRSPADLVAVHALARLAGLEPGAVEPVALLESRHELSGSTAILDGYLELPGAGALVDARGRRLEVMVGYSDSTKEVGVLAANIAIHRAERALGRWADARRVDLTVFHGRGGALGRGGGPANRAILGQPPGAVRGRFKVTEQGEVAFARYGNPAVARWHLEQVVSAVLVASETPAGAPDPATAFEEPIAVMERASERAYRSLVGDPRFVAFFRRVTPFEQISTLPIASRPVSRATGEDLEALRAIPWVFAWAQSRCNLAGWFGLGAGLEAVGRRRGGVATLRAMHAEWAFLRALLENAELSLAKADRQIAELYLERGGEPDLARAILEEHERSVSWVLRITGHARLLDGRPALQRALELRDPYVDALSFLQLHFLDGRSASAERIVQATINGVAAGLQNTG